MVVAGGDAAAVTVVAGRASRRSSIEPLNTWEGNRLLLVGILPRSLFGSNQVVTIRRIGISHG